jgi:hypothetical protein
MTAIPVADALAAVQAALGRAWPVLEFAPTRASMRLTGSAVRRLAWALRPA